MAPAPHPELAIIGSGLSGLSLALHLSAQGIKSTVYEFRPASYSQGGEIALSPNALRVLDHLGISNALSKKGFNSETMTLLNRSGKVLGVLIQGSTFGYSAIRLKRSFVKEALLAKCERRGVESVYGKRFVKLEEGAGKTSVFFEDGSMVSVDLVVGADGLRSGVRSFVNDKVKATYNGTMMIYGKISASALDAKMGKKEKGLPMPRMSFGGEEGSFTIWPRDPDAQEICFFANTRMSDRSREEWERIGADKEGLRKSMEKLFCQGGWAEQIQVVCREAPVEEFRICRYWGRNPFPISDSLMIYSQDNVSISPPEIIFINQLLTSPLPKVCQHGATTLLLALSLKKNNSDWRFGARHHSFRWSGRSDVVRRCGDACLCDIEIWRRCKLTA